MIWVLFDPWEGFHIWGLAGKDRQHFLEISSQIDAIKKGLTDAPNLQEM